MPDQIVTTSYGSTFPRELPPSLVDPAALARHDQTAFNELSEMLCHWDRPHRPSVHWLIQVGDSLAAVDLASRCQRYLPTNGLDPIPGPWIHLTVNRAGYENEIDSNELDKLISTVADRVRHIERFSLDLIPLAGSPGAVRLSVAPWMPLMSLFSAVDVHGSSPSPEDVFRPHVGVAYSSVQQEQRPIAAAVGAAAQELQSISIDITRLSLVKLWRAEGWYEWVELESVALK